MNTATAELAEYRARVRSLRNDLQYFLEDCPDMPEGVAEKIEAARLRLLGVDLCLFSAGRCGKRRKAA